MYLGKTVELTDRLIRSKRMPKVRKKRNYEGKIRGHNHHEYPYSLEVSVKRGCSDMLSCILIFIARFGNGHCTTCNCTYGYEYGGPATYWISDIKT